MAFKVFVFPLTKNEGFPGPLSPISLMVVVVKLLKSRLVGRVSSEKTVPESSRKSNLMMFPPGVGPKSMGGVLV